LGGHEGLISKTQQAPRTLAEAANTILWLETETLQDFAGR